MRVNKLVRISQVGHVFVMEGRRRAWFDSLSLTQTVPAQLSELVLTLTRA